MILDEAYNNIETCESLRRLTAGSRILSALHTQVGLLSSHRVSSRCFQASRLPFLIAIDPVFEHHFRAAHCLSHTLKSLERVFQTLKHFSHSLLGHRSEPKNLHHRSLQLCHHRRWNLWSVHGRAVGGRSTRHAASRRADGFCS